jgi:hypothetical protein
MPAGVSGIHAGHVAVGSVGTDDLCRDQPYYQLFTPDTLTGLPLDHFPMVMSYGRCGASLGDRHGDGRQRRSRDRHLVQGPTGGRLARALVLIERITRTRPTRDRCLAVCVFGWSPASVSQSLAEGHNDIALVALALLWMLLLLRAHWAAPVALVASALCKYVTAPLLLIDAINALRRERASWQSFLARQVAPGLLGLATLAIFYRSMAFFDGLRVVGEWHFLRPSDALMGIQHLTGLPVLLLSIAAMLFFVMHAAYWLAISFWSPTMTSLQERHRHHGCRVVLGRQPRLAVVCHLGAGAGCGHSRLVAFPLRVRRGPGDAVHACGVVERAFPTTWRSGTDRTPAPLSGRWRRVSGTAEAAAAVRFCDGTQKVVASRSS